MRLSLALTGLLVVGDALSGNALATDTSTHAPAGAPPAVNATVTDWMARTRVPGVAIARIDDGRVAWTGTWGKRSPDAPVDADTVFNVASLTKPVFAMMVLRQAAAGELDLDAPLSTHWVDPDVADDLRHETLTARIALSHQTGLPNWRGDKPLAFGFAPGERHEYSGEGFEYLRRAIERQSGQPMRALMQAAVLDPAGMEATHFGWDDGIQAHLATGFGATGEPYAMDYLRERGPNAAANMFTTIGDYGRFAAWVVRGAGLPAELFADMQRPQALHPDPAEQFGLGWRVTSMGAETVLSHDGRERGVRTQVFVFPATGDGLVILSNGDNGELLTRPLVEAALPQAPALLEAIDREIWRYLQRMPSRQVGQLAQMLPRSPPFMARLLYAADTALVADSPMDAADRAHAHDAIAPFLQALQDGKTDPARASALVEMLLMPAPEQTGDGPMPSRWRERFSRAEAEAWLRLLTDEG
ncbi:serine hydrolase domain-containing protein [Marilutibacter chinensis]|uniref:Beta-lactamase family protein n=1 Tax=Marilutibacter chinensis TaxID=2912247 RepID=A0ABS9HSS0_9GAMM|nr:serine hydrolase domain-containing protein [Lysobacter chinensis]MCF7221723.1 beta-lactamase family protein [Lysobacter chinensis]